MFNWIEVKEKVPPTDRKVLLAQPNDGDSFCIYGARISRPYDHDPRYNENYYMFVLDNESEEIRVGSDWFWCDIEHPQVGMNHEK